MADLLALPDLPDGFDYPTGLLRMVGLGVTGLEPWWILTGDALRQRRAGLIERYPDHDYVPFAARQDCDDVACWDGRSDALVIVHDFASAGWERQGQFESFEAWARQAFDDFLEWG